jgi:hypothetical protein
VTAFYACSKFCFFCEEQRNKYLLEESSTCHYGRRLLPRVPNALGEGEKHSGKPSPSATLGEEPPGMPLTGKRSSPSAKNRTLGEDVTPSVSFVFFLESLFPECPIPRTRGRKKLDYIFKSSSPSAPS